MHSEFLSFFLTGKRSGRMKAAEGLQPALYARYGDLTELRHDYPLILGKDLHSLSGIFQGAREKLQGDSLRRQARRLETEVRRLGGGTLQEAIQTLEADAAIRSEIDADGELICCDSSAPEKVVRHLWNQNQAQKAALFREELEFLILNLKGILEADFANSRAGRTPKALLAGVGATQRNLFDFDSMSKLLSSSTPKSTIHASRRARIESLIIDLETQPFFSESGYSFAFCCVEKASQAYRDRMPHAAKLARAIAIARLEVAGEYREEAHDPFFAEFGVDAEDLSGFPSYLVVLKASEVPSQHAAMMETFAEKLPVKVLVHIEDLITSSPVVRQLAQTTMGLGETHVVQGASSHLYPLRKAICDGLRYSGPALFSIFGGPDYLTSAAAVESRVFPNYVYAPGAGDDWASRFDLSFNPQIALDWPIHALEYEAPAMKKQSEEVSFTAADFLASEFTDHVAVPPADFNGAITVAEALSPDFANTTVPAVPMIDDQNVLYRVLVDQTIVREARKCLATWHALQELGGVRNSHAERLLQRERELWQAELEHLKGQAIEILDEALEAALPSVEVSTGVSEAAQEPSSDEPFIETPRCTTCNECTLINNTMFAYNENKQAYIKDPLAGTYRQLVEAAESCQVSIIHPGKPKNPEEPGLDELLKRAEPFL